jgi:capsular exopolysaccharide synthesis family protein
MVLRSTRLLDAVYHDPEALAAWVSACEARRVDDLAFVLKSSLRPIPSCAEQVEDRARTLTAFSDAQAVTAVGRSRVIKVSFDAATPQAAMTLTNSLIDQYLDADLQSRVRPRLLALEWLAGEVSRLQSEIRSGEAEIEDYQKRNGLVRGETNLIASESLSSVARELAAAQAERATVAARLDVSPGDPTLRAARDSAQARVRAMTQQFNEISSRVMKQSGVELAVAGMLRNVEAKRALYNSMAARVSELRVEERLVTGNARLLSKAELPTRPSGIPMSRIAAAGTILALILGAAAAVIRDLFDRTVRALPELSSGTATPVICLIPRIRLKRGGVAEMPWSRTPLDLQEGVRMLFGRTILMRDVPGARVLMLASAEAGAGKSFITVQLARIAAAAGRRVLVIECDLRRPTMGTSLKMAGPLGLTSYLRGEANHRAVVQRREGEGFDIVLAGAPTADSLELLSSGRMRDLVHEARKAYDVVLLDTPPVGALLDAHALAKLADDVVVCVNWGRSREDAVMSAIAGLRSAGAQILGLAVNRVQGGRLELYQASYHHPAAPMLPATSPA